LVWFKRDLRVADHAPLAEAARCDEAAALFLLEPEWLHSPECDAQHLVFVRAAVRALYPRLRRLGVPLLLRHAGAVQALQALHAQWPFTHLFSHEETGPGWSYTRDKAVAAWCRQAGVVWVQWPQHGVVRALRDRRGWAGRWQQRMDAPQAVPGVCRPAPGLEPGHWPQAAIDAAGLGPARPVPPAGEAAAGQVLHSFLDGRGAHYRSDLSSPLMAETGCSRLSAHLAFGALSVRQVHQATQARIEALQAGDDEARRMAWHLRGFAARLRWHCHFIQKLEDEPAIEWRNFARAYDELRPPEPDPARLQAWQAGQTGYPMVDACMRCLNTTGWLNFRMRAMLVSFAAYHLWQHWRAPGLHLARQFLDFEPGIHWSQMQMQSGTTGINTFRIYSPARQQDEHDPAGDFVRRWVPEWGTPAYPPPIVDERTALAEARARLWAVRRSPRAQTEAAAVQARHGSRKSGLPPSGRRAAGPRRDGRAAATQGGQGNLFS
jgi:deoxyribodipyrimidine photo-lyase